MLHLRSKVQVADEDGTPAAVRLCPRCAAGARRHVDAQVQSIHLRRSSRSVGQERSDSSLPLESDSAEEHLKPLKLHVYKNPLHLPSTAVKEPRESMSLWHGL